jgi:hypothetical protein
MKKRRIILVLAALCLLGTMKGQETFSVNFKTDSKVGATNKELRKKNINNNEKLDLFLTKNAVSQTSSFYCAFNRYKRITNESLWNDSNNRHVLLQGLTKNKSGTVYCDVLHDNIGPTRITLAAAINSDKSDSTVDLQSLILGGGNAALKFVTPVLVWQPVFEKTHPCIGLYTKSNLFFTLPQLGSSIENPQFGFQNSIELQGRIMGEDNKIGFFFRGAAQAVWGSKKWKESILDNKADAFAYASFSVGLMLTNKYTLSYAVNYNIIGANVLDSQKPQITLSANF